MGPDDARQKPVGALEGRPDGLVAEEAGQEAGREVAGRVEDGAAVGTEGQTDETNCEGNNKWLVAVVEARVLLVANGA